MDHPQTDTDQAFLHTTPATVSSVVELPMMVKEFSKGRLNFKVAPVDAKKNAAGPVCYTHCMVCTACRIVCMSCVRSA